MIFLFSFYQNVLAYNRCADYGYYSPWRLIFYYFRGLKEGDMAKVIEFIHGALEIAVKIQAASGPKLVDFKVNCIICSI